jgi:hypothetical protein
VIRHINLQPLVHEGAVFPRQHALGVPRKQFTRTIKLAHKMLLLGAYTVLGGGYQPNHIQLARSWFALCQ